MATTRRAVVLALLLLIAVAVSLSCGRSRIIDDPMTYISGLVTDSVTGLPIDSAIMALNDTTSPSSRIYTDTLGAYAFDLFGHGEFHVYCMKAGYKTEHITIQSSEGKDVFDNVDFALTQ